MNCLFCGNKLPKNRKKFCCNKHKDKYHNLNNPRGYFKHLKNIPLTETIFDPHMDYCHPFSEDAIQGEC